MLSAAATSFNDSRLAYGGSNLIGERDDQVEELKRKRREAQASQIMGMSPAGAALFGRGAQF